MSALLLALALVTADAAATDAATTGGSSRSTAASAADDYALVSWCYGALQGYLDLHDQVMPEVTRIETTFRRPGSNLAEDLAAYDQLQKTGRKSLALFAKAMEAAEQASLRPISAQGAAAVKHGLNTWSAAGSVPKARLAQEWMSWTLPAYCEPAAIALEKRARLSGPAFQVNAEPDPLSAEEAVVAAPAAPSPP